MMNEAPMPVQANSVPPKPPGWKVGDYVAIVALIALIIGIFAFAMNIWLYQHNGCQSSILPNLRNCPLALSELCHNLNFYSLLVALVLGIVSKNISNNKILSRVVTIISLIALILTAMWYFMGK
jgi:hypothetical protein